MPAFQSIRRLLVATLATIGLVGIFAAIGLLAMARSAVAAEKTADLAKYCRKHHGRTAFPSIDRRDNGLMCSRHTSGGLGLLHLKIAAAEVCAAQFRTRRFRRQGKGLICITGSGGGGGTAKIIDLKKYCRANYGPMAFVTVRTTNRQMMCTIQNYRGRGLRHFLINLASLCDGGSTRMEGSKLHCGGSTAGRGARGGARTAKTIDLKKHCRARYGRKAFVTRRRTDGRRMCTKRTNRGRGLRHHLINLASLCDGGSPRVDGDKLRCKRSTAGPRPRGGSAGRPNIRRPADVWLGKWSASSHYSQTKRVWKWWFIVTRSGGKYRIQTHTSVSQKLKIEILHISARNLKFRFHDKLDTRVNMNLQSRKSFTGSVHQPNNKGLPQGTVKGSKM